MAGFCPKCESGDIVRMPRSLGEKLRKIPSAWKCQNCQHRFTGRRELFCWRCHSDLDRRRRSQKSDYVAAVMGLKPYSCRRCGKRRYRWAG